MEMKYRNHLPAHKTRSTMTNFGANVSKRHYEFKITASIVILPNPQYSMQSIYICTFYFAGSMASSIFDPNVPLVGASGGVYALMTAQLANVVLVSKQSNKQVNNNK